MPPIKVFVSYSHDDPEHKRWVLTLATRLRENGLDVRLDQWDLKRGGDLATFMEQSISLADRVVVVCSTAYTAKANAGRGGVGYEKQILTQELIRSTTTTKFIPILRNNPEKLVPLALGGRFYTDFDDGKFDECFDELLRDIHGVAASSKPKIGPDPFAGVEREPAKDGWSEDGPEGTQAGAGDRSGRAGPTGPNAGQSGEPAEPPGSKREAVRPMWRVLGAVAILVALSTAAVAAIASMDGGSSGALPPRADSASQPVPANPPPDTTSLRRGAPTEDAPAPKPASPVPERAIVPRTIDLAREDSTRLYPGITCAGNPAMPAANKCVALLEGTGARQRLVFTVPRSDTPVTVVSARLELTGKADSSGGPRCIAVELDDTAVGAPIPLALNRMQGAQLYNESGLSTVVLDLPNSVVKQLAATGQHSISLIVPDSCGVPGGFAAFRSVQLRMSAR